ncbi:MAG: EAL domain-containing protein [Aquificaceae bacterium]
MANKGKSFTLQFGILFGTVAIILYAILYLAAERYMISFTQNMAFQIADDESKQVFNSMYQVMKRGWDRKDLLEFIKAIESSCHRTPVSVNIYRSNIVKELFGDIPEPEKTKLHELAFKGQTQIVFKDYVYTYITPVRAEKDCLKCHVNAMEGSILGLVETRINLAPYVEDMKNLFIFLLLLPAIMFSFLFLALITKFRSVVIAISKEISKNVEDIKSVGDVKRLADLVENSYEEIKPVYEAIKKLGEKVKSIAIDKDILELEAQLFERIIVTSKTIKEWHEYVKSLIKEMNYIITIDIVFVVFLEDKKLEVDVFWCKLADEDLKSYIEGFIKTKIGLELPISLLIDKQIYFNHHTINKNEVYSDIDKDSIRLRTKATFLDKPQIGGIVGMGLQSRLMEDKTAQMVVDSLLSVLINVVGSSKAISDYVKQVEFYATRDPLTFLYNQRIFWELLNYEIDKAKRYNNKLALLMLDVDNFKFINDTYGHYVGDMVLKEVARAIGERKRKSDIVARYGGDEFAIIALVADTINAYSFASSLKEHIEGLSITMPDGNVLNVKTSIGIALFPDHASTPEDLFLLADSMLRAAKEEGKGKIRVPGPEELVESYKNISAKAIKLLNALDKGEVYPYFQPIVDVKKDEVFGYEVLLRLGEERSTPSEFMDLAERMGIILKLDLLLYEEVFKLVSEKGYKGKIFLNMSPRAMLDDNFVESVLKLLKTYNLEPSQIVFELTERESIKNISLAERFCKNLKNKGFLLAIDDFGSGYSSFHYIKSLPVDFVKIDGEFIKDLDVDLKDRIFIESILSLAKGLGIRTIAEWVEREEVYNILKEIGVDYAQGFYLGKPSERFL